MRKYHYEETQLIRDIATIMAKNEGPFTRKMLAVHLSEIYPEKYYQTLMNEVSAAILTDKMCNNRFKVVRPGVWDLRERVEGGIDHDQED
jgi:hypothetical protein